MEEGALVTGNIVPAVVNMSASIISTQISERPEGVEILAEGNKIIIHTAIILGKIYNYLLEHHYDDYESFLESDKIIQLLSSRLLDPKPMKNYIVVLLKEFNKAINEIKMAISEATEADPYSILTDKLEHNRNLKVLDVSMLYNSLQKLGSFFSIAINNSLVHDERINILMNDQFHRLLECIIKLKNILDKNRIYYSDDRKDDILKKYVHTQDGNEKDGNEKDGKSYTKYSKGDIVKNAPITPTKSHAVRLYEMSKSWFGIPLGRRAESSRTGGRKTKRKHKKKRRPTKKRRSTKKEKTNKKKKTNKKEKTKKK